MYNKNCCIAALFLLSLVIKSNNKVMDLTPLQQKQLEFLEDTAAHYNLGNRSTSTENNDCFYTPMHNNTQGCAIGRHIPRDLAERLDNNCNEYGHKQTSVTIVFNLLPDSLKYLTKPFLVNIQLLHDNEFYWTEKGLSEAGVRRVESFREEIINGERFQ